ncbi:hypothetical protein EBU94_06175 [bacterium]|nr:hypothetical protein [bacterium]
MWNRLSIIGQSLAAMVSHDKVPPNTPPEYIDEMKSINFLRSKKFFIVFTSILMLLGFYCVSVFILFLTAPVPTITAPFVTIFVETIKVFAIVISAYLGLQAAIDFRYNSESNTSLKGELSYAKEEVQQTIIDIYAQKYKDDPSYAPLKWVEEQPHE